MNHDPASTQGGCVSTGTSTDLSTPPGHRPRRDEAPARPSAPRPADREKPMHLCPPCRALDASPTALAPPGSFELNRLLHVPAPDQRPRVAYRYYTCTACAARWLQVKYEDDEVAAWKRQR